MIHQFLNLMRQVAQQALAARSPVRIGLVSSFDPGNYSAKVRLMPEGVETGWLPVYCPWVGNGWGLFCPPSPGDQVEVQFAQDDSNAGMVCLRAYNDAARPLPAPSGEFWIVHQSGSLLKFHNNGSVELQSAADMNITAGGNLNANVSGTLTANVTGNSSLTTPQLTVNGNVIVNGILTTGGFAVTGTLPSGPAPDTSISTNINCTKTITATIDVVGGGKSLKTHVHSGVQPGSGNTGAPV